MLNRWRRTALLCGLLVGLMGRGALADGGSVNSSLAVGGGAGCGGAVDAALTIVGQSPSVAERPVDVMLTLDTSSSMTAAMPALRAAARHFVDELDGRDGLTDGAITRSRVGLVNYATGAYLQTGLSSETEMIRLRIESLRASGLTNIGAGITLSQWQLAHSELRKVMLVMTDGMPQNAEAARTAAQSAKGDGVVIYTIGLGGDVNDGLLREIASRPEYYHRASGGSDLEAIFGSISRDLAGPAGTSLTYHARMAEGFEIVSATASAGSVSFDGTQLVWEQDEILTASATVSYRLQHVGQRNGPHPSHATARFTWIGEDGLPMGAAYDAAPVVITGCNLPPVANAGPDQIIPMTGPDGARVLLDGSQSTDDEMVDLLRFTWLKGEAVLGTEIQLAHSFPLGAHVVALEVDDGEFRHRDEVLITVTDPFPPVTVLEPSGTVGGGGWYTSPVTVTTVARDNPGGAGVDWTDVSLDGGNTWDRNGGPVTISQEGLTVVRAFSADGAGNMETPPVEAGVRVDMTPPTIAVNSPEATDYADDQFITLDWVTADAHSGVASLTAALNGEAVWLGQRIDLSVLGPGIHTLTVSATDVAGHRTDVAFTFAVVVTYESAINLKHRFYEMGWIDSSGIVVSLDMKLEAAMRARDRGQFDVEANILEAVVAEVQAQREKHVNTQAADILERDALYLLGRRG